jgi:putative ATP-dependent endonuclease of OLD family
VNVLRDNDGDYANNVAEAQKIYAAHPNIKLISSTDNNDFSLEPAMISANATSEKELLSFAKIVLSTQTYNLLAVEPTFEDKLAFIVDWFKSADGDGKGKKKVDSAIKLFETTESFKYPAFLGEVLNFD